VIVRKKEKLFNKNSKLAKLVEMDENVKPWQGK
jgi:hypothetical protein